MQDQTTDSVGMVAEAAGKAAQSDFVRKIADKIKSSENILVTLSKTPTVDETAAAIGLTLFLEGMQRHVMAIYSGEVPSALGFLQPEGVFESNVEILQDFIIALDKNKADHLRYKLEGDFVKVFITPYKTTISEEDLTFARGDYNVDFVIGLNVRSMGELDPALGENPSVLHDATTVNLTTGDPGRFGEIEWSNPTASSVSEMVTQLLFEVQGNDKTLDRDVATALLAGIVAATDRFSNKRTSSDTLSLASKLMELGADQQLVSTNVATPSDKPAPEPMANAAEVIAAAGGVANPATEIAQGMTTTLGPEPVQMTTPELVTKTNITPEMVANTLPFDGASTVIRPVAPGTGTPTTAPVAQVTPSVTPAATALPPRPMATSQPELPKVPENGVKVTPLEPKNEPQKDYAAMMEQTIEQDNPAEMKLPTMNVVSPEEAEAMVAAMKEPEAPKAKAAAPVSVGTMTIPGTEVPPAPATVAPEVAEKPDTVLPPPPTPVVDGMMPPAA